MSTHPTTPSLLNDDGSASIATALMSSHHGFRRDLAQFAIALRKLASGVAPLSAAELQEEWQSFRNTLHGHHTAEDTGLFPMLRGQHQELAAVIDGLDADHRRIDPLLEHGDQVFAALSRETARAAQSVIGELLAVLTPHLALEEAHLVPHLRALKSFPPPPTPADVEIYAQGFAWSMHGIAPDVLERLYAMLPEALVAKLPQARAEYAQRCVRVWGTAEAGASRTPIPDWLDAAV